MALRKQGYLHGDRRLGSAVTYWRLRFRFQGRTRSVYLGQESDLVERVRDELLRLQDSRESKRERVQLERLARKTLRAAKVRLAPLLLLELGLRFHGDALRRDRTQGVTANQPKK